MTMRQSSVIFFFLFAAFIVFITQRGELPAYLGLLLMGPPAPTPATVATQVTITPLGSSTPSQSGASTGDQVTSYVENNAAQAAKVFLGF
jgi:hypothetical protein